MPTRQLGLSLGDRACLALADANGSTAVSADQPWKKLSNKIALNVSASPVVSVEVLGLSCKFCKTVVADHGAGNTTICSTVPKASSSVPWKWTSPILTCSRREY